MKKGGLLRDLEQKIECSQQYLNDYEKQIISIENEMIKINNEYDWSYKIFYQYNIFDNNQLIEYRDNLLNNLYLLNKTYQSVSKNLSKQKIITKFLMDCYYYVDKSIY